MGLNLKNLLKSVNDCNLCGSCNGSCPVYAIELAEPYSPRGKINLIGEYLKGNIVDNQWMNKLISVCLICGYCQDSCSKGVDIIRIFKEYLSVAENID